MHLSVVNATCRENPDEDEDRISENLHVVHRGSVHIRGERRGTHHISNPDLRPVYTSQTMFLPIEIAYGNRPCSHLLFTLTRKNQVEQDFSRQTASRQGCG
jgi:hypothetical protein